MSNCLVNSVFCSSSLTASLNWCCIKKSAPWLLHARSPAIHDVGKRRWSKVWICAVKCHCTDLSVAVNCKLLQTVQYKFINICTLETGSYPVNHVSLKTQDTQGEPGLNISSLNTSNRRSLFGNTWTCGRVLVSSLMIFGYECCSVFECSWQSDVFVNPPILLEAAALISTVYMY